MISELDAKRAALEFLRSKIDDWDSKDFVLTAISESLPVEGCYVFGWGPRPDDPRGRLGGNWPVLVDVGSGQCRFVAGVDEYFKLKANARKSV